LASGRSKEESVLPQVNTDTTIEKGRKIAGGRLRKVEAGDVRGALPGRKHYVSEFF
jgi:hypothetical protein